MYFPYGDREIEYLKRKDKKLARIIDAVGHIEREIQPDLFTALVFSIVGQQISSKAHQSIWKKLNEELGNITPQTVLSAGRDRMQQCGISYRKADYIGEIAEKITDGSFDPEKIRTMSDSEAIAALSSLRGVGVWTAEMLLIFCLCRPDVLSFGDFGIVKGMRMVYRHREIDKARFERYRRRLSPCCTAASMYFWAVAGGAVPGMTDPAAEKKVRKKQTENCYEAQNCQNR